MKTTQGFRTEPAGWRASPPPGWEPVAELCHALYTRIPEVVARIDTAIQAEVLEFTPPDSIFSSRDLHWTTHRNVASFLNGLAENRRPGPEEVAFRQLVGELTARRGLPLQAVMASFHVAYRELWAQLIEEAESRGGDAPSKLLHGGESIWRWMLETTNALADAYGREAANRDAAESRSTAHLLTMLTDQGADDAEPLAKELGFDVGAPIHVLALAGATAAADAPRAIAATIAAAGGLSRSTQHGRSAIVLTQGLTAGALRDILAGIDEPRAIGVGSVAETLAAVPRSLREAEHALEIAHVRGGACWFDDDWLAVIGVDFQDSLRAMLVRGVEAAQGNEHLCEAVRAFAICGFSIAEGARMLQVSESSFRYRLSRWETLTGWSPTSFDGLARSMLALDLAAMPERPSA